MKIVKSAGEWARAELRPILTFTGAGAALIHGSADLIVSGWLWLGERLGWRERLGAIAAGGYLAVYSCAHAPHVARFVVPGAAVAWCVAAWWAAAADTDEPPADEPAGPDPQDVADLVRDLVGDDKGVLLTALCQPLHAADTRAVRELLAAAGVAVRPGVRTRGGNGPGVHRDDLPPLPADPSPDDVAAGETANTNANNKLRVESREGMTIINDPADRHRTQSLKKAR